MGLLDAYEESASTALRVMDARPVEPEKPKQKHSAWSAPLRAVAAGGAEVLGNVMDTAGAFGQVAAASGGITPGFDPDLQKNREQSTEAMDKLKQEGINWRTDESQQAYKFGADLRPDPLTAGTAENLVFSLTKGLTKAVGAAATLGPVAGAAAFGTSEGLTAAEDLANQGVDQETRTKVGLVTAGFNAAGVALPVAGQTLKQTAGLVLAGGPASFMAQQQATRSILENADYGEIAKQYDPLDPVGLIVSTLVPAGFAAYAKRGWFGVKPDPVTDGQPLADNAPEPQGAVMPATQESIDAAMVQNLTVARDVHQEVPPQKFAAEMWRGPVTENPNFKAWFGDSKVTQEDGAPMVVYHGSMNDIAAFDATKGEGLLGAGTYLTPNAQHAGVYADKYGQYGGNIIPAYVSMKNPLVVSEQYIDSPLSKIAKEHPEIFGGEDPTQMDAGEVRVRIKSSGYDGIIHKEGNLIYEIVAFDPTQIKSAIGNSGKFDPNSPSLTDPIANDLTTTKPVAEVQTPDAYAARVDALTKEQPDLIARLDDSGQPVKLSDELAAIKKEAQEGTDTDFGAMDAPLLKIAAECALAIGTAGL